MGRARCRASTSEARVAPTSAPAAKGPLRRDGPLSVSGWRSRSSSIATTCTCRSHSDATRRTRFRADGAWVFFADAGRGWLVNAPGSPLNLDRNRLPPLSSYQTDIGAGLSFEHLGVYVAKALSVPKEPMNVFLRVRH